jgi:hypothetical protein
LQSSCNLLTTNGNVGYTGSIVQSKKIGAFISEYQPLTNPYRINDSLSINIKSAWIERSWTYGGLFNDKAEIDSSSFHLILKTDRKGLKDCLEKWLISVNGNDYFTCASGEGLIGTFHMVPGDSIVKCKVEYRPTFDTSHSVQIIGYFKLRRIGSYKNGSSSNEKYHGKLLSQPNSNTIESEK